MTAAGHRQGGSGQRQEGSGQREKGNEMGPEETDSSYHFASLAILEGTCVLSTTQRGGP